MGLHHTLTFAHTSWEESVNRNSGNPQRWDSGRTKKIPIFQQIHPFCYVAFFFLSHANFFNLDILKIKNNNLLWCPSFPIDKTLKRQKHFLVHLRACEAHLSAQFHGEFDSPKHMTPAPAQGPLLTPTIPAGLGPCTSRDLKPVAEK